MIRRIHPNMLVPVVVFLDPVVVVDVAAAVTAAAAMVPPPPLTWWGTEDNEDISDAGRARRGVVVVDTLGMGAEEILGFAPGWECMDFDRELFEEVEWVTEEDEEEGDDDDEEEVWIEWLGGLLLPAWEAEVVVLVVGDEWGTASL